MPREISNSDDMIDIRDVMVRVEELETEIEDAELPAGVEPGDENDPVSYERDELSTLTSILDDLKGNGGDEKWRGDWYPVTLISYSYFEQYAKDLADSIGVIDSNATWPLKHIDWRAAADELKADYSSVDFDGTTYWYR